MCGGCGIYIASRRAVETPERGRAVSVGRRFVIQRRPPLIVGKRMLMTRLQDIAVQAADAGLCCKIQKKKKKQKECLVRKKNEGIKNNFKVKLTFIHYYNSITVSHPTSHITSNQNFHRHKK